MLSAVLSFFGITLVYTGYLAYGRDPSVGFAVAFIGFILLVKPALGALGYYSTHFGRPQRPAVRKGEKKGPPKKMHLKVITPKSDKDDRPTIH